MLIKFKANVSEGLALLPPMCDFALKMFPRIAPLIIPFVALSLLSNNAPDLAKMSADFHGWGHFWITFFLGFIYLTSLLFIVFMVQSMLTSILAVRGFQKLENLDIKPIWQFGWPERWAVKATWALGWSIFAILALLVSAASAIYAFLPLLLGGRPGSNAISPIFFILLGAIVYTLIVNRIIAIPMSIQEAIASQNPDLEKRSLNVIFANKPTKNLIKRATLRARPKLVPALIVLLCMMAVLMPAHALDAWYWSQAIDGKPTTSETILKSTSSGFRYFMFNLGLYYVAHWIWRETGGADANQDLRKELNLLESAAAVV